MSAPNAKKKAPALMTLAEEMKAAAVVALCLASIAGVVPFTWNPTNVTSAQDREISDSSFAYASATSISGNRKTLASIGAYRGRKVIWVVPLAAYNVTYSVSKRLRTMSRDHAATKLLHPTQL